MLVSRREFLKTSSVTLAVAAVADPSLLAMAQEAGGGAADFTEFLDGSGDELLLAGRPLSWWTATFDLPLQVSYGKQLRANLHGFLEVFRQHYPKGEVRFAGKADTHPTIFRLVGEEGAGIDVASPYEMKAALEAGIPGHLLDLNGNAKDDGVIEAAIAHDMLIVIDSIPELERVATLAAAAQKMPRAVLRLSGYDLGAVTASAIFTAGLWTKFGINIDEIPALLPRLKDMPVRVLGFHTHIGSQITDLNAYLAVLGRMLELGALLKEEGHAFEIVNIGGGYPVSYLTEAEWDVLVTRIRDGYIAAKNGDPSRIWLWDNGLGALALEPDGRPGKTWQGELFWAKYPKEKMLEAILLGEVSVNGTTLKTLDALAAAGTPTLVVEPGRAIVGDAGMTFLRTAYVKQIAGIHPMLAMEMGVVFYAEAIVGLPAMKWAVATEPNRRDAEPFDTFVAGNLCFNADMLSRLKVRLQRKPARGDILMIAATGAYSPTFFAANANSFPRPARILVETDGSWSYIHRRDTYDDIFSLKPS